MRKMIKPILAALSLLSLAVACAAPKKSYKITDSDKEKFADLIEQQHTLMGTFYSHDFTEYDVTGDGCVDLCTTLTEGSGIVSECIIVYDAVNQRTYELNGRNAADGKPTDYWIDSVKDDGIFIRRAETPYNGTDDSELGKLAFDDGKLYFKEV